MSGDKDVFSLKGLFFKAGDEDETAESQAVAVSTAPSKSAAPLISTLGAATPAGASTVTGPSARTLKMLAAAQEKVPADNAQLKLDAAMESIKTLESDPAKRRAMALAMLQASQGISPEQVYADAGKARELMAAYLGSLDMQLEEARSAGVVKVRADAAALRERATALEAEITRIRGQQNEFTTQAGALETKASTEEGNLNAVATDIEAALALVNTSAK